MTADTPPAQSVSLIAPMRNEAGHVEDFIDDIAAQDFAGPLELLVADGASSDGSSELLRRAARRAEVPLLLLDNPKRYVPHGLNACICASTGDLIVRLDIHSRYPPDYVRLCLEASNATGAANVGGILVPTGRTRSERAVAAAMDGPFGGIGWTTGSSTAGPIDTDTVPFGAFRRGALIAVGCYDEQFVRNQDDELNLRLRRAGERVVLEPRIRVAYVPRGRLRHVFKQYFDYGRWKVPVMRKHRGVLGLRSLAPAAFVVWVVTLAVLAPWFVPVAVALAGTMGVYLVAGIVFGVRSLRGRDESLTLLPRVIGSYGAFHIGYGVGMIRGLVG